MFRSIFCRYPFLLLLLPFCLLVFSPALSGQAIATGEKKIERSGAKAKIQADKEASGQKAADESDPDEVDSQSGTARDVSTFLAKTKENLDEAIKDAKAQDAAFAKSSVLLKKQLAPHQEEFGRLLLLRGALEHRPVGQEAIQSGLTDIMERLDAMIEDEAKIRGTAQKALDRVNRIDAIITGDENLGGANHLEEIKPLLEQISQARKLLQPLIARYDKMMEPVQKLRDDVGAAVAKISEQMPERWRKRYLSGSEPWLDQDTWKDAFDLLAAMPQIMWLRLPAELPVTAQAIRTACMRGLVILLLSGFMFFCLRQKFGYMAEDPSVRHGLGVTMVWICLGLALSAASFSARGANFNLLMALGNLLLIVGQMCLAWNLRRIQLPEIPDRPSPLWRLMPTTICAYVFLYLPLPAVISLALWLLTLIVDIIARQVALREIRKPDEAMTVAGEAGQDGQQAENDPPADPNLPPTEKTILSGSHFMVWLCLIVTLCGFHSYGMILYLLYSSISLAVQLCFASLALCNRLNERLSGQNGDLLSCLLLALAAPLILVLALVGVSLWLGTLPGGLVIMRHFILQGDFSIGTTQLNMIQILLITTAFFVTRTIVSMGVLFLERLPQRAPDFDVTLIPSMRTVLTYVCWILFGLYSLKSLGLELSNLAVVAGGLSVGIGFGMQNVVSNFISGMILIFSRNIQVGDVVEVGGTVGEVRKISIRATVVQTYDNALIFVPNSEFVSNRLTNWTRSNRSTRRDVSVGVAYGSDTALVSKLLLKAASATDNILRYPTPTVFLSSFADSSLDFTLRFWVSDYNLAVSTSSALRLKIDSLFRENGIEIPFPQMDLHVRDGG